MNVSQLLVAAALTVASASAFAGRPSLEGEPLPVRTNAVCKAKAEALVKAVYALDFAEEVATTAISADEGKRKPMKIGDDGTWSFIVEAQTQGAKFPLQYRVQVEESGPAACYLRAIAPIQN